MQFQHLGGWGNHESEDSLGYRAGNSLKPKTTYSFTLTAKQCLPDYVLGLSGVALA